MQVQEDADDFEIAEAAMKYGDPLAIKKVQLEAKKKAVDDVMGVLVDREADVSTIMKVMKEADDLSGDEVLV